MTTGYSILHFLTDGLCAYAMFGRFADSTAWYVWILVYNFCAFALQLPFGAVMDGLAIRVRKGSPYPAFLCAVSGLALCVAGAWLHPAVLGVGNALFHVGGGIGTMEEDRRKKKNGALLGIFVSPGAIGLYLGTVLGKQTEMYAYNGGAVCIALLMSVIAFSLLIHIRRNLRPAALKEVQERMKESGVSENSTAGADLMTGLAVFLLFIVVVIRSYTGMNVSFSWKTGFAAGFTAVLALACGKALGGILSAAFGMKRVLVVSLAISAAAYYFSSLPVFGIAALLTFNMTMPMTLYLLAERFRDFPGTSFGLLTFALFIGFLPAWFGLEPLLKGNLLGTLMSLASLLILFVSMVILERKKDA